MMLSDLPEDLVKEILSMVPARCLKRLRSTCKQWNALFNDHRFTENHFVKAAKEFLVFMLRASRVFSVSVKINGTDHNNIDPVMEVIGELRLLDFDKFQIFHCNGLLLCTNSTNTMSYGDKLVVHNPCMRQTRWVELRTVYKASDKFALGYKKNNKSYCKNYKVLRYFGCCVSAEFEMYELKSNSWRVLEDITYDWHLASEGRGVSLKGNTYWIASDRKKLVDDFLLEFDFTDERFQRMRLPFKCDCHYDTVVLSTVREEKLAVLFQDENESTIDIWLTNKIYERKDVSWRMFFTVGYNENIYMFAFSMSFMVYEENKVAVCCDTFMEEDENMNNIFVIGEDKFIQVDLLEESPYQQTCFERTEPFLFNYVPSFVQI